MDNDNKLVLKSYFDKVENFVANNMNELGYKKMVAALLEYKKKYDEEQNKKKINKIVI